MDTPPGGWLVIQKRNTGKLNFNFFWKEYREGFGNIAAEYWLGLDNMFLLTNQDHYELRVDIWDFDDNKVYELSKSMAKETNTSLMFKALKAVLETA